MSDALEVLRAKVEAATPGDARSVERYHPLDGFAVEVDGARISSGANENDAALLVLGWNLAKRLCADEWVEAMAWGMRDNRLERAGRSRSLVGRDPLTDNELNDARAAIRAILGEQP